MKEDHEIERLVRPFHEELWQMFEKDDAKDYYAVLINLVYALTRHSEMSAHHMAEVFRWTLMQRLCDIPADDRLVTAFRNLAVELTGISCTALETQRRTAKEAA